MRHLTRIRTSLAVAAILLAATSTTAFGQGVPVSGTVMNSFGRPVPGLAVSMIHPIFGRSSPAFTDAFGQYTVWNVPPNPIPYYIEVYWGNQLIYRQQISVSGPLYWPVHVR